LTCALAGCAGGSGNKIEAQKQRQPDFSLVAAPSTISVVPGGEAQSVAVITSPVNGFTGNVMVTLGSLPTGVTATLSSLSIVAGYQGQFKLTASASAVAGTSSISLTGTSNTLSHNAAASLTVTQPGPTPSLSATAFDFGNNLVNNTVTRPVVTVTNAGLSKLTMNPTLSGDPSYSIASGTSCGQQLDPGANCNMVLNYTPTTASAPAAQGATLNMGFGDVPAGTPQTVAITGTAASLPVGQVVETDNPQVALYTMTLPFPGSVTVSFGKDTSYGLRTWSRSTDVAGGKVSIFVAGMQGATTYHMQAAVAFANGITANDTDHTFTTKDVPANMRLNAATTTTAGMTPQPGLELLDSTAGTPSGVVITDLSGNVVWTYANPGNGALNYLQGVKVLPNGNFLVAIGANSTAPLSGRLPAGTINEIREVNLAGDTVREISIDDLNASLAAADCTECHVTLAAFHHDFEPLPNGHWLVLSNTTMALSSTSQPALTNTAATTVLGDVIVDLDENLNPVWVWNEFNHLDPNRHPFQFPDWTHTNAVVYSKDDGNLLVSIRHQNWVLKVNYADGSGDGSILWRLGQGGDFTLNGGTDPTDWQYAQHLPAFFSPNTSGVFSLGVMDNGDDRIFPSGVTCGSTGAPPCHYSTIPVWQIDEGRKTANLTFQQKLPTSLYSFWGGSVDLLENGNVEYCLSGVVDGSRLFEVTQDSSQQTVWSMHVTGASAYRGFRIPSLYPGVQW
jgi:hypothetical protein